MHAATSHAPNEHFPALGKRFERRKASVLHLSVGRCVPSIDAPIVSFWLVLRGGLNVHAREGEFLLDSGDWLALEAESKASLRLHEDTLVVVVHLYASEQRADWRDDFQLTFFAGRGRMPPGARVRALRLWRTCLEDVDAGQAKEQEPGGQPGGGDMLAFLAELQAGQAEGIQRCPGQSMRRRRQIFARMQRASLYLQGRFGVCARIGEIARWSNFSSWYFSKVFQAVYGMTPQQFAARLRLEHASRLLVESRLPVTEVSMACGFDSPCGFARAFRARYGISASEYRLLHAHPLTRQRHCRIPS